MGSIQKFGGLDEQAAEDIQKELNKAGSKRERRLGPGRVIARLLPTPVGTSCVVVAHEHWLQFGPKEWQTFCCPRLMAGQPCPECEEEKKLAKSRSADDQDLAWRRSPQASCFTNAMFDDMDDVVQLFKFAPSVYTSILNVKEDVGRDPWDLTKGFRLSFTIAKDKTQRDCKVGAIGGGERSPLDPDGEWVNGLFDLSEKIRVPTFDEVLLFMNNENPWRRGGERKKLGAGRRAVASDDDEEEEPRRLPAGRGVSGRMRGVAEDMDDSE